MWLFVGHSFCMRLFSLQSLPMWSFPLQSFSLGSCELVIVPWRSLLFQSLPLVLAIVLPYPSSSSYPSGCFLYYCGCSPCLCNCFPYPCNHSLYPCSGSPIPVVVPSYSLTLTIVLSTFALAPPCHCNHSPCLSKFQLLSTLWSFEFHLKKKKLVTIFGRKFLASVVHNDA